LLFYILETKSILDKIVYKIVYLRIIYLCDFFVNLDDFLTVINTGFHGEIFGLHLTRCLINIVLVSVILWHVCVRRCFCSGMSSLQNVVPISLPSSERISDLGRMVLVQQRQM
jgi:hypothetical protein